MIYTRLDDVRIVAFSGTSFRESDPQSCGSVEEVARIELL